MQWDTRSPDPYDHDVQWSASYEGPSLPGGLPQCFLLVPGAAWDALKPDRRGRLAEAAEAYSRRVGRPLAWREHDVTGGPGRRFHEAYLGPVPWGGELHLDVARALPKRCPLRAVDLVAGVERDPRPPRPPRPGRREQPDDDVDVAGDSAGEGD